MKEELKDGKLIGFDLFHGVFSAQIEGDGVKLSCAYRNELPVHMDYIEQIALRLLALVDTIKSNQPIEVQP